MGPKTLKQLKATEAKLVNKLVVMAPTLTELRDVRDQINDLEARAAGSKAGSHKQSNGAAKKQPVGAGT